MAANGVTTLVCVTVLVLEASAGVLTSLYVIIIIILLDFHRRKNVRTGNKIRIALSFSIFFFSIVTFVNVFSGFFWSMISRLTSVDLVLHSFTMFFISSCSWLSASLSFFYFIKIVNVKSRCLTWVKTHISSLVSWVILVAELVSFGSFCDVYFLNVPSPAEVNTSVSPHSWVPVDALRHRFLNIILVVTFVPLLTVLVTTITIAVVLRKHRRNIEQNMGPSGNVNTGTYRSAIFRMLRLLFFFVMFYVMLLIFYLHVFEQMSPGFWVTLIIMSAFTPVQSILIVLGNSQLKNAWKELTRCVGS